MMNEQIPRRTFHTAMAAAFVAAARPDLWAQEKGEERAKQEWGNLSATVGFLGEAPDVVPVPLPPMPGRERPVFNRDLDVDFATKGLANVVAWLYTAPRTEPPQPHPDYEAAVKATVELAYVNYQLEPRITLLQPGQKWKISNTDPVGHALMADVFANPPIAFPLVAGGSDQWTLSKSESRPMPLTDAFHAWVQGWLLVRTSPYMAVSDSKGKLEIKNLPVGKHVFVFWHEKCGFIQRVQRNGEREDWKFGRLTVEIKPGDNDLGAILCNPLKPLK